MSSQEILTEHTESSLKFDSFKPMAISTRKNSINSNSPKRKLLSSTSMELGSSPCRDKKRQKRTIPVSGLEYVLHSMGIDTETIGALQCKPLQDFKKQIHKPINESMNLNLPLYSFDEAGFDQVCEFVLDQYKAEVSQITVEMDQLEKVCIIEVYILKILTFRIRKNGSITV